MRTLEVRVDGEEHAAVGVAASTSLVHWVEKDPTQERHGSGFTGRATDAGTVTVISLVRGRYEVRLATVSDLTEAGRARAHSIHLGGWPISGDEPIAVSIDASRLPVVSVSSDRIVSRVYASATDAKASTTSITEASPLGQTAIVPWLLMPVPEGRWVSCMVELSGISIGDPPSSIPTAAASYDAEMRGNEVTVTWPDGVRTVTTLMPSFPLPESMGNGK